MNELIEQFKEARSEFIDLINMFPPKRRPDILFGQWSLKDVLAHIIGWDLYGIDCLQSLKDNKQPYWHSNIDEFNQEQILKRKNWTWQKLHQEFVSTGEKLIKEYETLPLELWNKRFWPDKRFTPRKFLEIDINHYRIEHALKIKDFLLRAKK
jgi:hypothetical protein